MKSIQTQSQQHSKSESKKYQIPMAVTNETIRDFCIDGERITWAMIGNRKRRVVMVDATEEQYYAYMRFEWAEVARDTRSYRCTVPGKNGKPVRCPQYRSVKTPDGEIQKVLNKCENCENNLEYGLQYHTISLSQLEEDAIDPVADDSPETIIAYKQLREEIIAYLTEINPKYGLIFQMLYQNYTQSEIARATGIPKRTISDAVAKVRQLAQDYAKEHRLFT